MFSHKGGLCDGKAEAESKRENPWEEVGLPVYISVLEFPD